MTMRDRDRRPRRPIQTAIGWLIVPALVLIGIVAWPFLDPARFSPGPHPSESTGGGAGSDQAAGGSQAAKDSFAQDDASGGRARAIKNTAEPLSLTAEQLARLRDLVQQQDAPRADELPFSLEVGVALPREFELRDLPPEASRILGGYEGDQYVMVRGKLVIVDRPSRRIAAIVPDAPS